MVMLRSFLVASALAIAPVSAQEYAPVLKVPAKAEVVIVFISTSSCTGNQHEHLDSAIRELKQTLSRRAEAHGIGFAAVGVAAEWSIEQGVAYLLQGASTYGMKNFGAWDEIHAGRQWMNSLAIHYVWRDIKGMPIVPQIVILERSVSSDSDDIEVGPDTLLVRLRGSQAIVDWVASGMALPTSRHLRHEPSSGR